MRRSHFVNLLVVILLTALVMLTLTPLFLMFHTSIRPVGTLTKGISRVQLAHKDEAITVLKIRFHQDIRKFASFTFLAKGSLGGEQFRITLSDIRGGSCRVDSEKYLKAGLTKEWQEISIPISDFNTAEFARGLPEKIAEIITIEITNGSGAMYIEGLALDLKKFTLANYIDVFTSGNFRRYFFNSALIAALITIGNIFFCTIVGYAFARKDFAFKQSLFLLILASLIIPPQAFIVPIFVLMKSIGWLNTYWALIIPSLVQPFGIFLMKQYISRLPASLEDQARVDGAKERQIIFRIIFPLSTPALAIVAINTFMGAWNTFLFPFILTNTAEMRTLPVGLALFNTLQGADWVHLMAASSITAMPVILVFLAFQKHIIAGLTTGLVKR
ncbi:MAG: carbohydrate ABC transporter permease [Candidatus Omnitrophica bacterium]|nr:carbohydrate ABC transporter permease [Candidatus Omnitrophota bacterium]